jgi:E3 ubiquitin-protein ligase NEDD4
MRKRWRIEFAGEPGIEAGGLTREWFQLVTEQIFDPDFGLWLSSDNNQMSMRINGASRKFIVCPVSRCWFDLVVLCCVLFIYLYPSI